MLILIFSLLVLLACLESTSAGADTISPTQFITNGETLISSGQIFELGFFSKDSFKNVYLGLWYKETPGAVVWVANRENPISGSNGTLKFTQDGNLLLLDGENHTLWASNTSGLGTDPICQLLDSGNLVIGSSASEGSYLWESFDYLVDTLLAGMKMVWSSNPSQGRFLVSWRSPTDPSPGEFTYRLEDTGLPQFVLQKGTEKLFRSGPWNGVWFTGYPAMKTLVANHTFVYGASESFYMFELIGVTTRLRLDPDSGKLQRLVLGTESWQVMYEAPYDTCDKYNQCGANGVCLINKSPICGCLPGFVPKSETEWQVWDWANGCTRRIQLSCVKGEGFLRIHGVKLPDLVLFSVDKSMMNLIECKAKCLKNCSCTAYSSSDVRNGGSGCLMWYGNLIDVKNMEDYGGEQDIYIRLAALELESIRSRNKKKRRVVLVIVSTLSGFLIIGFAICCIIWKKRNRVCKNNNMDDLELPLFGLATISTATNNFSSTNIIGEGGFGTVYKGELVNTQLIAVKRLSKDSGQGLEEFKNEVILFAKLQHRNLVRLLGCCIEGEERMLIYEFMPNKSLDKFIFDREARVVLTWRKRFDIIMGVVRGLLYLHRDSRLNIIHRDLKPSNILLDSELNPKISDFGLARKFGGGQNETRTRRVVGTYGYMSPEYAIHGKFSVKSDIFGFGVLLLEIVSGRKNREFYDPNHHHTLLGHAWMLWNEDKELELIDNTMKGLCDELQVLRCIQVGLLCVQNLPEDRPTTASVVFMLGNDGMVLPEPKRPGFFFAEVSPTKSSSQDRQHTKNVMTITMVEAR